MMNRMPIYQSRCHTFATGKAVGSVHESFGLGSQHRSPHYYIHAARAGETPNGLER